MTRRPSGTAPAAALRARAGSVRSAGPWTVLVVLLVVPLLALAAWWAVANENDPTQAADPVEPLVTAVQRQDVRAEAAVTVTLGEAPGREVASAVDGVVTQVVDVGTTLGAGAEVLRVDDRPVRALVAAAPPWRELRPGDRGPDVARVQQLLVEAGYLAGAPDGSFDVATRRAVERWNVDAGRGRGVTSFDPATVVWVGPEPLVVTEVLAPVGTRLGRGVGVVRGPTQHDVVVVTEGQGGVRSAGDFGDGATLTVGTASVPYVPGSGAVTAAADVLTLRDALAPSTEGSGQVQALQPVPVVVVPASALVQGADGALCVYETAGSAPLVVEPVGGGVGSVQLPGGTAITTVVSNPGRVGLDHPCGS